MSSETVFDQIDKLSLRIGPFDLAYAFSNVRGIRRNIMVLVVLSMGLWMVLGFDSTWEQINPFLEAPVQSIQALLSTGPAHDELLYNIRKYYGIGNHWSAPVIYGLAFLILSRYLEAQGIVRSLNFFVSTALSLANIGIFEFIYNRCYSLYQSQWWTFSLMWPNARNILFFSTFVFTGVLSLILLHDLGLNVTYKPWKIALIVVSLILWVSWIYYPGPVGSLTVQTDWGLWTNSRMFPQTFYAVDVANDGLAKGIPYHVENNVIHLLNTITKIFTSGALLSLFMVERR